MSILFATDSCSSATPPDLTKNRPRTLSSHASPRGSFPSIWQGKNTRSATEPCSVDLLRSSKRVLRFFVVTESPWIPPWVACLRLPGEILEGSEWWESTSCSFIDLLFSRKGASLEKKVATSTTGLALARCPRFMTYALVTVMAELHLVSKTGDGVAFFVMAPFPSKSW